jgi:hypothetical protein
MKTNLKEQVETRESFRPAGAEQRLKERGIKLPAPPEPFGTYVEAVQTGNLLFLSGMLPTEGHAAKFTGRVGEELDLEGVCHSDVLTVEGSWPGIQCPRVPGHEVAGIIDEVGAGVSE